MTLISAFERICQAIYNVSVKQSLKSPPLDLLFRALADPTRLRLLNLIADKEICVCYFVDILRTSQPKISRHLAYLRKAGVVTSRRQGRWMHYRLAPLSDEAVAGIMKETLAHLRRMPEMRADLGKLESACCSPNASAESRQAPQPLILPIIAE